MVNFLVTVSNVLTGMRLAKGNCFSSIIAVELFPPPVGLRLPDLQLAHVVPN
jgi:hypothetical protein